MKLTNKQLEKLSGAILTSFVNLHFLEEVDTLGILKRKVKYNVKRTIGDLLDIETKYFDKIEELEGSEMSDKLVANKLEFIKWLLNEFDFNDYTKIQEVCVAYTTDRDRLTSVSDKILLENKEINDKILS